MSLFSSSSSLRRLIDEGICLVSQKRAPFAQQNVALRTCARALLAQLLLDFLDELGERLTACKAEFPQPQQIHAARSKLDVAHIL